MPARWRWLLRVRVGVLGYWWCIWGRSLDEFFHDDRMTMTKHGFQHVAVQLTTLQGRHNHSSNLVRRLHLWSPALEEILILCFSQGDWKPKFSQFICLRTRILILWTHLLPWANLFNVHTLDTFATLSKLVQYHKFASLCHPCKYVLERKFERGFVGNENSDQIRNCPLHLYEWAN